MAACTVYSTQSLRTNITIPTSSSKTHVGFNQKQVVFYTKSNNKRINSNSRYLITCKASDSQTIVIGLAADSGCGKSTFMRRLTSVFGGAAEPPKGGNPDSNTLISDTTTVICLDDYHSLDRTGRKEKVLLHLIQELMILILCMNKLKLLKMEFLFKNFLSKL
jgi:phosphoribulokinase